MWKLQGVRLAGTGVLILVPCPYSAVGKQMLLVHLVHGMLGVFDSTVYSPAPTVPASSASASFRLPPRGRRALCHRKSGASHRDA